jgi:hypothetical protein
LAEDAHKVEDENAEAKLARLEKLLRQEGFFDNSTERLLIFTEYRDTLEYLIARLKQWNFRVGFIHGGMKPGSREEKGTRLYEEQQFKDGAIQVLVATEAAGEGINLQSCHIMFNYDIPWNPNRLEQRMGRIHRYGQIHDCLIFNFVATNTIEGRILQRLLEKLQEIRDALDDDAVFNVVGEILPAAQLERVLRDYYAGKMGEADLEERVLRDVSEDRFRSICQNALEGLAAKKLNLDMLIERRARAQERRVVPETIARFLTDTAVFVPFTLQPMASLPHTFNPGPTPTALRRYESEPHWKLGSLVSRYPRLSTDRATADQHQLEWVTPGHPLFEALRRHTVDQAREPLAQGACFHSLKYTQPARLDIHRARVVDGLGDVIHERLFVTQLQNGAGPVLQEIGALGDLQPAKTPDPLPEIANAPEAVDWLQPNALQPFLDEVRGERLGELDRIAQHVELSLTELLAREDQKIGRFAEEKERGVEGAAGNLAQAEERHAELLTRRERRREELARQRALSLQAVERFTSVLVLPHPEGNKPEIRNLRPDPETEAVAMRVAIEHEREAGRAVADVHEQNLGYDLTSLDTRSGELRLIEVKGLDGSDGTIVFTPNEHRVAEDRRDCYWLYVVRECGTEQPKLREHKDPAANPWKPVQTIAHYTLTASRLAGD